MLDFPIFIPPRPTVLMLTNLGARRFSKGKRVPPGFMFIRASDGSRWILQVFGAA